MNIEADVIKVLAELKFEDNRVIIQGQLDKKLYKKVDEVLQVAGFDWNRKAKAHIHSTTVGHAHSLIAEIIERGSVIMPADIGFFETPVELAKQLVEWADVEPGMFCLEPSAGGGRIVDQLLAVGAIVTAIEHVEGMREKLSLNRPDAKLEVPDIADFMEFDGEGEFDRVVMNPPFRKVGKGDHLEHTYKAFECLKAGGILMAVLPAGVAFREDRRHREFAQWAKDHDGVITHLPDNSFKESGTMVKTVKLRIVR